LLVSRGNEDNHKGEGVDTVGQVWWMHGNHPCKMGHGAP
jgi:hypothetical protein